MKHRINSLDEFIKESRTINESFDFETLKGLNLMPKTAKEMIDEIEGDRDPDYDIDASAIIKRYVKGHGYYIDADGEGNESEAFDIINDYVRDGDCKTIKKGKIATFGGDKWGQYEVLQSMDKLTTILSFVSVEDSAVYIITNR